MSWLIDAKEWNSFSQVSDDYFQIVTLGDSYGVTVDGLDIGSTLAIG